MDKTLGFKSPGPAQVEVDLAELKEGKFYEDRYNGYLDIFERIAALPGSTNVIAHHAPWSWVPLLQHLKVEVRSSRTHFKHCGMVRAAIMDTSVGLDRTALEVLCSFRPETADALWKCDNEYKIPGGRVREYPPEPEFIITTNGSYHRKEVLHFMETLRTYKPRKGNVLLVPCAADKPYPAPMHRACLNVMPDDFYMMNATGVVGLVPQDLWDVMPFYDSGIPNQWRLLDTICWYFQEHHHDRIICYVDFYSETIYRAFKLIDQLDRVEFVLPVQRYDNYLDLMDVGRLEALRLCLIK